MENVRRKSFHQGRVAWVTVCVACLLCATLVPLLQGCAAAQVHTLFGLGAVLKLVCYEGAEDWFGYAEQTLAAVQASVDCDNPDSSVARFNAAEVGERVQVDAVVYEMVLAARQAYDLTAGAYDPTAYWLVDLWGFSPRAQNGTLARPYDRAEACPPDARYIEAFRSLCDFDSVLCAQEGDVYTLCKTRSVTVEGVLYTTALDLGGIAKGFVVQRLVDYAVQKGIAKGYVSFGSSSVGLLSNKQGKDWDLSLRHPRREGEQTFCTIPSRNLVLATSGDYENYYLWQGERYCHLIDPATGAPIRNGVHSVTVLGQDACLCDALATGLAIRGQEAIEAFAESEACRALGLQLVVVYGEEDALRCYSTLPSLETKL